MESLESACDELREKLDRLRSGVDTELAAEVRRLQEENHDRKEGMENLHVIIRKCREEIAAKDEDLSAARKRGDEMEVSLLAAKRAADEEESRRALEIGALQTALTDVTARLTGDLRGRDEELAVLRERLDSLTREKERLCEQMSKRETGGARTDEQPPRGADNTDGGQSGVEEGVLLDSATLSRLELSLDLTDQTVGSSVASSTAELRRLANKVNAEGVEVLSLSEKVAWLSPTNAAMLGLPSRKLQVGFCLICTT